MVKWLLIAALATIGVTALLIGVIYRANRSTLERARRGRDDGGNVIVADAGSSRNTDSDGADGGSDGGGGGD